MNRRSVLVMAVSFAVIFSSLPAAAQKLTKRQQALKREYERRLAAEKRAAEKAKNNKIAQTNRGEVPEVDIEITPVDPQLKASVIESAAKIDALVEAKLASLGIEPNPPATDEQFARRAYLDIVGTIPRARQMYSFLASKEPDKRSILIDHLLNQPGYAGHMFNFWADVLRVVDRNTNVVYLRPFGDWLKESFRQNVAYDQMVYEILTAEGKVWENPAVGYKARDRGMPLDNLNNTVRIFLGTQIGCAQCHDHPFDRWTQEEFYKLAAFEGGVLTDARRGMKTMPDNDAMKKASENLPASMQNRLRNYFRPNSIQVIEDPRRRLKFPQDYYYSKVRGKVVEPDVIFGDMPKLAEYQSRREAFADWATSKDNPRFALTIANRMWKRAMGVGVIEPVDDMMDDTEPSNPELMDFLVSEMKRLDFNLKEFMRIIYHTRTYQRQVSYDGYDPTKPYHFPGPVLRRMTAEQVWDSLLTLSIKAPDAFLREDDSEYIAAVDADASTPPEQLLVKYEKIDEAKKAMREAEYSQRYKDVVLRRASELPQPLPDRHFLRQFGQSDRELISAGTTEGTVPQLLTMFNGPVTHMMLEAGSVIYIEVMAAEGVSNRIRIIFLSILGRNPTSSELAIASSEMRTHGAAGYGNVIWALLNTREFLFIQ